MKAKVYLETTIPSYPVGRLSRDLLVAAHQQITRDWWDLRRAEFDLFVSEFVIEEVRLEAEFAGRVHLTPVFANLELPAHTSQRGIAPGDAQGRDELDMEWRLLCAPRNK